MPIINPTLKIANFGPNNLVRPKETSASKMIAVEINNILFYLDMKVFEIYLIKIFIQNTNIIKLFYKIIKAIISNTKNNIPWISIINMMRITNEIQVINPRS